MKNLILITFFLLSLNSTQARSRSSLKIEPVYGIERTQRLYPEPAKTTTETFVGVRALYGTSAFSFEFEVNTSRDTEKFTADDLEVTYVNHKVLLGFRTYPINSKMLGMYLRFGARGSKQTREIEELGVSRTEDDPVVVDPYAGAGITFKLANAFALNAGATLVYNRNAIDEEDQFDTRYTFSFTIKAGTSRR